MGDPSGGPIEENGGQNGGDNTEPSSLVGMGPPSPLTGCYLLIILGEPHSAEHKDIILQRLVKGLLSWDALQTHVDLEDELNNITVHAPEGEDARHGERLIQYASENLVTEILIHPQYNTLIQCMRNLLSSFTRHRHIIHAGYTFSGNGSWILQDGTFSVSDFAEAFQEHDVQRVLRAYPDTVSMDIHCDSSSGLWNVLPDKNYAKTSKIRVNPVDVLESGSDRIKAFIDYLTPMLNPANLNDLLESSDVVGNIRFSHPTLYVFPGGQGDAALFGINGFNMLVDGGFNRKSCFWNFARHLDRLDAVLMTRINNSNIQGIGSVIERKASSHVYPGIGHFFCNIPERRAISSPDENKDKDSLVVDLFDKGQKLISNLKTISLKPQMCYRDIEPMNLYHKVGHGTLDMYVISPGKDSREVKEFMQKWTTNDQKLFTAKDTKDFQFPLQNLVSICALLVWQPANPEETITRILFPGSTPDYKIMEGLDKIKHLEFMKYPMCTAKKLVPSISTATITKKVLKSAINEKSIPEPILPSKTTKSEKDNQPIDNKAKTIQDNKAKESRLIEEQAADKKAPIKARPKKTIPKKTDSLDEKQKDDATENKEKDDEKVDKPQVVINGTDTETEQKDETDVTAKPKKIEQRSKMDTKTTIKSRIDSKPPKSMDKKIVKRDTSEKKEVGKQSPTTTPKKTSSDQKLANGVPKEREIKPKVVSRVTKSSPSSTPAKSTKEANNRKVLESKQKAKTIKREIVKTIEKKEEKIERKPISHRTKGVSPSRRPPDSPKKSIKPKTEKDNIIRKAKLDKGGTTDSSLVSTPSADDALAKKIVDAVAVEDVVKQRELDDLKEEQEAVREIEEVFKREEKSKKKDVSADLREVAKQDSATEAEDDEEYLIIEKEEVEQYTEDSINEQESSMTKEEEMQKHQRDSQESEKKRKSSLQTTEEEVEPKVETEGEDNVEEKNVDQAEIVEQDKDVDDVQPDSIEDAVAANKLEPAEEEHIKEEVQEIITSAKEIAKIKSESKEEVAKTEEMSSPTPEDKLSSTKKTSDTKDDLVQPAKDGEVHNLPESQPFSTTIESGATTAPTLPEDERIPLDEIKEDLVVEEKYIKEETKEVKEAEATASSMLQKTYEPLERVVPTKMHFDTTQPHLRDIVKTPDEVADLPVHEEADIETYEGSEEAKDDKKTAEKKPTSDATTKEEVTEDGATGDVDHKIKNEKIPNGSVVNKVENEKVELLQDLAEDKKYEEEHPTEEKEEDPTTKPTEDKPIFEKVEVTGFKEKDSTMAEKVEYAVEDLGSNFETKLKDVTQKDDKIQSEKDQVTNVATEVVDVEPITETHGGKEVEIHDDTADEQSSPKDEIKDFVNRAVSGVSSFMESASKAITDKVESLVEATSVGEATEPELKEIPAEKEEFKEVFDYSHPFGMKTFPTELRETHITTLDSPVAEKDKIIDLKILDKLPEAIDEEHDEIIAKSMVPPFHPDDFKYASFERDDSNLKDIKEEEEEDRSSPPSNEQIASRKESAEISDLTNKDTITVIALDEQPSRAVSPREEEVLKIVANVAEVLKSEKDITEIIPDFSEEELERKLRGASPRLDDENATVQRMLVTTSSEDGGEEIEICPEGTIKFSPTCTTPEVLSGKATPDVPKDVSDTKLENVGFKYDEKKDLEIHLEKQTEKDEKGTSDPSTPEAKTSSISIDEKEKHELPEKAQVDTKTEKLPETIADKSIDETASRKESVVSDFIDDVLDRRESAFSEKDFTKDESSIDGSRPASSIGQDLKIEKDEDEVTMQAERVCDEVLIVKDQSPDVESVIGKEDVKPKDDEKSPTLSDLKVEVSDERRESTASHVSDKSGMEISRPDSIISHFSDKSEPELREKLGSSPDSMTSIDKAMAYMKTTTEKSSVSRPESAASHISDADKTEEDTIRGSTVTSPKSESMEDASKKSVIQISKSKTPDDDVVGESEKEPRPISTGSLASEDIDGKGAKPSESPTSSKDENVTPKPHASSVDDQDARKDSRPESVTKSSEEETECRPASAINDKEVDIASRPESVASSKGGQSAHKEQTDISVEKEKESRPASTIEDKEDLKESRPESVASSNEEKTPPKEQYVISGKKEDESRPASAVDDKEEHKDSRPGSVTSSKDGKEASKEEINSSGEKEKESRPESVASSKSAKEASKELTDISVEKESRPASVIGDKGEHKDSRPESVASSKDGKEAPKEQSDISGDKERESRPASVIGDKDEHKDSRPESVASSKGGKEAPKEQTGISVERESRPASVIGDKDEHKDSRPESVASSKGGKEAPKEQTGISVEKESRPASVIGDKDEHKDSRPESVASSKDDKEAQKEQSDISDEKEIESRLASTVDDKDVPKDSRPESVASSKSEQAAPKEETSPPSSIGDKGENKDSRRESVASSKGEILASKSTVSPQPKSNLEDSRPLSAASNASEKSTTAEHDSRRESVASTKDLLDEKVAVTSRPDSVLSSKSNEVQKESRPQSAASHISDKEQEQEKSRPVSVTSTKETHDNIESLVEVKSEQIIKDSRPSSATSHISSNDKVKETDGFSRPESVIGEVVNDKDQDIRPASVASSVGDKKENKDTTSSRSPSVISHDSDKIKEIKEPAPDSRPLSAASFKDEKDLARPESVNGGKPTPENLSRPASIASNVSMKEEIKESASDTRPTSAASLKSEKLSTQPEASAQDKQDDSRPLSAASSIDDKKEDKEPKDTENVSRPSSRANDSRPPSVASITSDKIDARDKAVDQGSRPLSATSVKSDKENSCAESEVKVKDSRSASVTSLNNLNEVKVPEEKGGSRPSSNLSHVSEKEVTKVADEEHLKDLRSQSITSQVSDKAELTETKESSRPASEASSKDNKDITRPESVLSEKLEQEQVKISRPPSSTSHISDKEEITGTKESSRPASEASSKDNKDITRPESVLSEKLEQEQVKTSRPPSSASHISDKAELTETKEISRPASVASSKEPKDITRPESVLSEKLEQEQGKISRPPSSASHISDKAEVTEAKDTSRPASVASSKELKDILRPESEPNSRPPSATNHVSDKADVQEVDKESRSASAASFEDNKDKKRPESALSDKLKPEQEQAKDSRSPSVTSEKKDNIDTKSVDDTRSPSVASHTSDNVHTKQLKEEKDSRPPSVASHVSDKEEIFEVKPDSRPPSSASSVKDGKCIRPESVVSDKFVEEDSRPLSAQSSTTVHGEAKLEAETSKEEVIELQKSSRPSSVGSHVSDKVENEVEKEIAKDSRSASVISKQGETARPESAVSEKSGKQTDSRPPSCNSNLSEKMEKDIRKDSQPISVGTKDEDLSRPHSQSSTAPEDTKESSGPDAEVYRSSSATSHHSDALHKDSRPASSLSQQENAKEMKISRPGSVTSNVSNNEVLPSSGKESIASQPEKQSRPESSASSKHGDNLPRSDSVASHASEDVHKLSRPSSVSSHRSDDKQQISRPASAASNESDIENSQKILEDLEKADDRKQSQSGQLPVDVTDKQKDSRSASVVSSVSDVPDKDIHLSRPASVASHVSEKDCSQRPGSAASQISESRSPSRRESAVERCSIDDVEMEVKVKDSRSKSVSSIMMTSMYKPEGFEPMAAFEENVEQTKDDLMVGSTSRKASDITDLIDDVKKIDAKIMSSNVVECKIESSSSTSPENELSDKISTETILSGKSSPSESKSNVKISESLPCSSLDAPKSGAESLSGKSTPDVADIEKKILEETSSKTTTISQETTKHTQSSKQTDVADDHDFDHISISEKVSKTIEVTSAVISEVHTTTTTSSSETQSQSVMKDGAVNKDIVTSIRTEFRSYTPSSDDFDINETNSPRSDVSAGHVARVVCGWTGSDDDMTNSPLSTTSQAPCSPPSKFTYETEYELQRSSSGVSKRSEFDIDDSQDDVPPEYGSEEVASAIPIPLAGYKADPMKTSVYGKLPESEPIPITTTIRTVITKQYDEYASSGPDSSSCVSQESARSSSDHRFLDEADLDFEKALEEHRQVRGSDVMSSVTSKYEFSPSKAPLDSGKTTEFPLSGVQRGKSVDSKSDQPSTSESQTKTEEEILKEQVEERVLSWGKPMGLPSPLPVESQTTPKRERKLMISKTKMNNEKNLRKRSESPIKGKKVTPIYMDLTYVPHNGNSYYSHVEFFKRIRARYYVFSGTEPSRDVYNALLEAKQTWEDKELEVTIIPTYDTDVLGYWVSENEDLLAKYHIDLSPSASRCTINLQDHETSCSAYRLEF